MLNRSEKDAIIQDLKTDIGRAKAIFLTNLIGITSNDAVSVRKAVRDNNGKMVVTRNTLFKKAAAGTPVEALVADLHGPHALAFAFEDPAAVAKSLKEAGASLELVDLKGGVLDGQMLSKAQVKQLADLPSRDQMLGTLLATFLAPVSAFARVLFAIQEKKEKGELA
ncbi:50S ribosomal protein L10 [Bacteriovorax stolpii]|uniref:Large ribosomal subunit protein uL10 n=1 Tax=Bacteriovorax stolpii TaxID=960 RepID=A0A2K9NWV2_BACTC|nr:50S ribosomal protein L10 [Bacteriovorax stolpii]AUN99999.1 50S ribosomal protein L10 [Bacteriovorax stolpii]QDK40008.1 50S ribosomal protein L10 [Bacteriovorax stolpii]TDP54109.1 LSU ribosomal protein L10P [Bacteriovorax stolpii]BDT30188.1 50S ribosomal protein L10 [Bacteriovorax sp. HI3]